MQNFTTATGLGFISNFDYFWTEQDLFKRDGLHLNRMGTSRLINNLINFTAFSLKWHFAQLDPAQCPNPHSKWVRARSGIKPAPLVYIWHGK